MANFGRFPIYEKGDRPQLRFRWFILNVSSPSWENLSQNAIGGFRSFQPGQCHPFSGDKRVQNSKDLPFFQTLKLSHKIYCGYFPRNPIIFPVISIERPGKKTQTETSIKFLSKSKSEGKNLTFIRRISTWAIKQPIR